MEWSQTLQMLIQKKTTIKKDVNKNAKQYLRSLERNKKVEKLTQSMRERVTKVIECQGDHINI